MALRREGKDYYFGNVALLWLGAEVDEEGVTTHHDYLVKIDGKCVRGAAAQVGDGWKVPPHWELTLEGEEEDIEEHGMARASGVAAKIHNRLRAGWRPGLGVMDPTCSAVATGRISKRLERWLALASEVKAIKSEDDADAVWARVEAALA